MLIFTYYYCEISCIESIYFLKVLQIESVARRRRERCIVYCCLANILVSSSKFIEVILANLLNRSQNNVLFLFSTNCFYLL